MTKRPRGNVFISSTRDDLIEYRKAVRDVLITLNYYPVMMEYFPAMDETAVQLCMQKVDESQIYIGVFAHRYGYCPENSEISITEMEYDRASANNIKRLCFFVDETHKWPDEHIEGEPSKSKLRRFKSKISAELVRGVFTTPENLQVAVMNALAQLAIDAADAKRLAGSGYIIKISEASLPLVQILISDEVANFDQIALREAVAELLNIEHEQIRVLRVSEG